MYEAMAMCGQHCAELNEPDTERRLDLDYVAVKIHWAQGSRE